ncbi:antibiotic biosynthesis monooxygenase family protein [Parageobacillus thermoglucosidasius]|uniref:antibiotic biosynthesis monooxygenase family protein n=1 Tax=Parageobacillus thermoglucosidasius TaxID=1426 RepID=UPI000B56A939|nr:hypothetical protein [Parageobacillus thermoglucosidasius]OUM89395.1 MAG: hypothetical protein BAA00_09990 [Parageobacillus thermoglucosidasius]
MNTKKITALFLLAALWGASFLFMRIASPAIGPVLTIELRMLIAGITVSYWDSLATIQQWKENAAHKIAQEKGKQQWYERYSVRGRKAKREYDFEK